MEEFFERLNDFHKKYSRYFLMLLLIVAVIGIFYILPYVAVLFLPFIIGWIVSFAASPMVKFLKKKLHVPYMVGAIITVLILLSLLALIVVTAVSLVTDASGYVIESGNSKITVATDLGHIDRSILPYFDGSDFVFIESNHDLDMLKNGPYHYNLKRRILSDFGHLSNKACSELVCYLASRGIKKFMLGHLSDSNNTPGIALAESTNALKFNGLTVDYLSVAPKDDTSEIITV